MCVEGGGCSTATSQQTFPPPRGPGAALRRQSAPAAPRSLALQGLAWLRPSSGPARAAPDLAQSSALTPGAGPGRPSSTVFPSFHREKFLAARLHSPKLPRPQVRALTRSQTLPRGPAGGELVRVGRSRAGKGGPRGPRPTGSTSSIFSSLSLATGWGTDGRGDQGDRCRVDAPWTRKGAVRRKWS